MNTSLRLRAGLALLVLGVGREAAALTPESPVVKAAIEKAVAFLESPAGHDDRPGAQALVGLVFLKNHADPKHPRIAAGCSYVHAGVDLGDQQTALLLFAVGQVLGMWEVLIPERLGITGAEADQLAGSGLVYNMLPEQIRQIKEAGKLVF